MEERKRKRGTEFLEIAEETGFLLETSPVEVGSGYSISICYDEEENPIVRVKTYGEVDVAELRKEIKKVYPNAKIEGIPETPKVRILTIKKTETKKSKKRKRKSSRKRTKT